MEPALAAAPATAGAGPEAPERVRTASLPVRGAVVAVVTAVLAGCAAGERTPRAPVPLGAATTSGSQLHGTEIGDVIPRPRLTLPAIDGTTFDLTARPEGELTLLFFGYTRCPDVCPTTMADLAAARRQLVEQDARRTQAVFVTEDPAHDTAAVLRPWLDRFDPSFVGLVGGDTETQRALDALAAPRTEIEPAVSPTAHGHAAGTGAGHTHTNGAGDTVDHTGSVYAFIDDRVVVYTGGTTPGQYAKDFARLLHA